ncbi:hypothetical protein PULV_a4073 [Pseudoalteromonas ulvae UL12]|uniref:zinc-finger-containing protein n=1 Tax=Pseudoalteromonas ulvae TaxID=107327 RepID=UPI0019F11735|nr:zinc-finger-containing protein [Pseudoalteromonas ulvae]MBE0362256.1 hypothetical protein [Pseudoalteromonas ulvae UL12]
MLGKKQKLRYSLKRMLSYNGAGFSNLVRDKDRIIDFIVDTLLEGGYRGMSPYSIKPKHIKYMTTKWREEKIGESQFSDAMRLVYWWVVLVGKTNILVEYKQYCLTIYCCKCEIDVEARLTNGREIYPHSKGVSNLPFWICDGCSNYVGCHHKTKTRIKPLGHIPSKELRNARKHIHILLDPIWKDGLVSRSQIYADLSKELGWSFHIALIRSIEEARNVYRVIRTMKHKYITKGVP